VQKIEIFLRNSLFSGMACATSDQGTSYDVPMTAVCNKKNGTLIMASVCSFWRKLWQSRIATVCM